ncbi:MAG: hypothetical protein EYC68_06695 [Chloroflexota bacterium]|nr:MAG: hypothetical protein EYC68_06695 [Chloroflexota bacterium]
MERVQSDTTLQPAAPTASGWRAFADKTLPLRYPLFALLIVVLVAAGQLVEDRMDTLTLEMLTPSSNFLHITISRWSVVLLGLYMILMLYVIQHTAARSLRAIRPSVRVDDQTFEEIGGRMTRLHWAADLGLALLALAFVLVLFLPPPLLGRQLPIVRHPVTDQPEFLPQEPLNAIIVLIAYWVVGWAALSLLWNAVRMGRALGDLAQKPLALNVFDTDNVLPLGRLALVLSLAPAGVVLILFIGQGRPPGLEEPTGPLSWFAILLASLASVLALILPLRGVHRQMDHAKREALGNINHELSKMQEELLSADEPDAPRTAHLANRAGALTNLRKVIQEGPTWPFRDSVAVSRAVLIASAPLIYAVLTELINKFILTRL